MFKINKNWMIQPNNYSCAIVAALNAHYFYHNDEKIFKKYNYLNKKYNNKNTGISETDDRHMLYNLKLEYLKIPVNKSCIEDVLNVGLPISISSMINGYHTYLIIHDWLAINVYQTIKKIKYEDINFAIFNSGDIVQSVGVIIPKEFSLKNIENQINFITSDHMWKQYYNMIYDKYKKTMYIRTTK